MLLGAWYGLSAGNQEIELRELLSFFAVGATLHSKNFLFLMLTKKETTFFHIFTQNLKTKCFLKESHTNLLVLHPHHGE